MRRRELGLIDGIVMDTEDPQQMGRLRVWCPAIDGDLNTVDIETLPWVTYLSPLAGQTREYPAGATGKKTEGLLSYGFWAIPKIGAKVVVGLLYGDPNVRFYLGSFFGDHGNRSLPTGRNRADLSQVPVSDTLDEIEPQTSNLNVQFGGNVAAPEARTRGAYERQVAQDKTLKDGAEGYQRSPLDGDLDPQTYCLTTPGRHSIIFQDHPATGRVRIKTAEGHQVILDDANERIYVSTCHGKTWIEMDRDGHLHFFGAASVSVAAGDDINLSAGGDVNVAAKGNLNLAAGGSLRLTACADFSASGATSVNISSGAGMNFLAAGDLLQTGASIHLNGPAAAEAPCAGTPSIVPQHEPWTRPATSGKRGPNWKP